MIVCMNVGPGIATVGIQYSAYEQCFVCCLMSMFTRKLKDKGKQTSLVFLNNKVHNKSVAIYLRITEVVAFSLYIS